MRIIKYLELVFIILIAASCTEMKIDYLDIDTSKVTQIPAEGGSTSVFVSASTCPTVRCTDDWLKYKIIQIDGEEFQVVLSADATKHTIVRYSTVTFSLGELSRRTQISQDAKQKNVNVDDKDNDNDDQYQQVDPSKIRTQNHKAALAIAEHGGYVVTKYEDNGKTVDMLFSHTTDNPAVDGFEDKYPEGFQSLSVSYEEDHLSYAALLEKTKLVLVFNDQSKAVFNYDEMAGEEPYLLNMVESELVVPASSGTLELPFDTNIETVDLTATTSQPWIEIQTLPESLVLTILENKSSDERKALIKLASTKYGLNLTWEITQEGLVETTPEGMVVFEDRTFKQAVLKDYDSNNDGQISIEEAETIQRLDVSGLPIKSLKGIEPMRNLRYLNIKNTKLSAPSPEKIDEAVMIDLSDPHPYLIDIICDNNFAIDVTGCAAVVWIKTSEDPNIEIGTKNKIIAGRCQDVVDYNNEIFTWRLNGNSTQNGEYIPKASTDFSQRNNKIYLNRHTKGPGIRIEFTIDGLIDTDVESELDERIANRINEVLFEKEPLKSYKEYFDIIYNVSVKTYRCDAYYDMNSQIWLEDLLMIAENGPYMIFCEGIQGNTNKTSRWQTSGGIIVHEIIGHNFAHLQDSHDFQASPEELKYFTNVWFIDDETSLPWYWKELMNNPNYQEYVQFINLFDNQFASDLFSIMSANHEFCALERFIVLAHIIYRADIYKDIFSDNIYANEPYINYNQYYELCEKEKNQQSLMQYFLEYDKKNL